MIFEKSIKNQILSILGEEPLSFRKISNRLRKEYHKTISDRTLYRILQKMMTEGTLSKDGTDFQINREWLNSIEQFKEKVVKSYIGKLDGADEIFELSKEKCTCEKGYAEGFCFVCNNIVCSKCGEKTKLHYSCFKKCSHEESNGKCENCLKETCIECSKEIWTHFATCIKKREKFVMGILEVDHECWFADLSEKINIPISLNSFIDSKDPDLGTHSGRIGIRVSDKARAINEILKHKQIVEVRPLHINKQLILRTRAAYNKSVDKHVRMNKSILLNPVEAIDTKERNLVIAPSIGEMQNLSRILNEFGNCKIVTSEEMNAGKNILPKEKELRSFVKKVDKKDLENAVQRMRLIKRFYE